jgi:hypothetical protein
MSGPKRNPDKLNSIGIVVVGICGAVLVYVSIVALQAFYLDDTAAIQTMADYGGQDSAYKALRTRQRDNLKTYAPNPPGAKQTYRIDIDVAMRLVVESAKTDPSKLVPELPPPVIPDTARFGRPDPVGSVAPPAPAAPPAAPDGAGSSAAAPSPAPAIGNAP